MEIARICADFRRIGGVRLAALPGTPGLAYTSRPIAGVAQLVEQSLRKREVGGSSPSTGTSLSFVLKYALALVSVTAYVALALLAEHLEALGRFRDPGLWFHYAAGAVFGALVLGPYAVRRGRVARIVVLAVAGAAIYWLAVRFVTETPLPFDAVVSLVVAGSLAALLCGLAVVAIAPRAFRWGMAALLLVAGALGGAAFDVRVPADELLLIGHAAWQLLVCLALHFALRPGGLTSSSAS